MLKWKKNKTTVTCSGLNVSPFRPEEKGLTFEIPNDKGKIKIGTRDRDLFFSYRMRYRSGYK